MDLPISGQYIERPPLRQDIHYIIKDWAVCNEFVAQVIDIQDLFVWILCFVPSKFWPGEKKKVLENKKNILEILTPVQTRDV